MNLIGERITLRAIEEDDMEMLRSMMNDPQIENFLGGKSFPVSKNAQKEWFNKLRIDFNELRLMIESESNVIGTIILNNIDYINGNAEIHIKLLENYSNKGYGSEAVKLVLKYAFFELRLESIYAHVIEYNEKSIKMFKKIGFKLDGVFRKRIFKNGQFIDVCILSMMKEEFL